MTDVDERLRQLLGDEPPASVRSLPESAREELADLVAEARRRQALALEEAFDAALRHVPFPARGIVRRVLVG